MYTDWKTARQWADAEKPEIIDLRSEGEFLKGAVPGSVNIPLLNNAERHEIGCLYKREGRRAAVHQGLVLFAARAEEFLKDIENRVSGNQPLLLYCWRGGMRSALVARWLQVAGFQVSVLQGGYKTYRKWVLAELDKLETHPKLVLHGRTGCGKTLFLQDCLKKGIPGLDFEGLARHRGSVFGGLAWDKPPRNQQDFENHLAEDYQRVSASRVLLVEIEGAIGPVCLSAKLRGSVRSSPMLFLERDFEDRVELLARVYGESWDSCSRDQALSALEGLHRFLAVRDRDQITRDLRRGELKPVIRSLLKLRYDPAYDKALSRHRDQMAASYNLSSSYQAAIRYVSERLQ